MPDDSSGIYSVPAGTIVTTGDTILPSQHNPWANDSASAISNRFSKDGRAPATGNWNINNFRITGLGAPVASGDAVNKAYADDVKSPWIDIASAATTDIGSISSQNVRVTGAVTITSFGTSVAGTFRRVRFESTPLVTYNATSLILPGGVSFTASSGDVLEMVSEGSGNWRCVGVLSASSRVRPSFELIETKTISGTPTNLDFTGLSSAYDSYDLVLRGLVPTTNASDLWLRVSTDGGATFITGSAYNWGRRQFAFGSTASDLTASADSKVILANNVSNLTSVSGVKGNLQVIIPATGRGYAGWALASHTGSSEYNSRGDCGFDASVNAIRLLWGSGSTFQNVNSVSLYGRRK